MVLKKFLKFVKKNDCFNLERCFKLFKNQKHFKQYSLPSQFWYMIPALTTPSSMSKLKSNNSVFIVNKFHYKNPKSGETLEEYISRLEEINGKVPLDKMDTIISIYSGKDRIEDLKYKPKQNETFDEYIQRTALDKNTGFFRYFSETYNQTQKSPPN